jgi:hypothetical protein
MHFVLPLIHCARRNFEGLISRNLTLFSEMLVDHRLLGDGTSLLQFSHSLPSSTI